MKLIPSPDLPEFRLQVEDRAFNAVGLDFAGPLFYRNFSNCKCCKKDSRKSYILLLTCATTRASTSTERDIEVRLGQAWGALHKLDKIWKSNLSEKLKRNFFRATVESVLIYGSVSWTLTSTSEKKIDGAYTRMLRAALNIPWQSHTTNEELYEKMPRITQSIRQQRMRFVGHSFRSKEELAGDVLLWQPKHGKQSTGRPKKSYIDQLISDTGCSYQELPTAMGDRDEWRKRVMANRASST